MKLGLLLLFLAASCGGKDAPTKPGETPTDADTDTDTDTDTDSDTDADTDTDAPEEDALLYSGTWTLPTPANLIGLDLPVSPTGSGYTLIESPFVTLVADPALRDARTAAGGCLALVIACYEPGIRNLPGCFANVPRCATSTPWEESAYCCDATCGARYAALRATNEPPDAAANAILADGSCMPGYDTWRNP